MSTKWWGVRRHLSVNLGGWKGRWSQGGGYTSCEQWEKVGNNRKETQLSLHFARPVLNISNLASPPPRLPWHRDWVQEIWDIFIQCADEPEGW
ncbi:hypothetical protein BT69DRAFT_1287924 [Atractiella rhizophila]|nr:hypothetical protein BT69DRAFT_1287924 [Atractiella rhizophila]